MNFFFGFLWERLTLERGFQESTRMHLFFKGSVHRGAAGSSLGSEFLNLSKSVFLGLRVGGERFVFNPMPPLWRHIQSCNMRSKRPTNKS